MDDYVNDHFRTSLGIYEDDNYQDQANPAYSIASGINGVTCPMDVSRINGMLFCSSNGDYVAEYTFKAGCNCKAGYSGSKCETKVSTTTTSTTSSITTTTTTVTTTTTISTTTTATAPQKVTGKAPGSPNIGADDDDGGNTTFTRKENSAPTTAGDDDPAATNTGSTDNASRTDSDSGGDASGSSAAVVAVPIVLIVLLLVPLGWYLCKRRNEQRAAALAAAAALTDGAATGMMENPLRVNHEAAGHGTHGQHGGSGSAGIVYATPLDDDAVFTKTSGGRQPNPMYQSADKADPRLVVRAANPMYEPAGNSTYDGGMGNNTDSDYAEPTASYEEVDDYAEPTNQADAATTVAGANNVYDVGVPTRAPNSRTARMLPPSTASAEPRSLVLQSQNAAAASGTEGGAAATTTAATGDVVYDTNGSNNEYDRWGVHPAAVYATPTARNARGAGREEAAPPAGGGGGVVPDGNNHYDVGVPSSRA